jgi:hypothetical protein
MLSVERFVSYELPIAVLMSSRLATGLRPSGVARLTFTNGHYYNFFVSKIRISYMPLVPVFSRLFGLRTLMKKQPGFSVFTRQQIRSTINIPESDCSMTALSQYEMNSNFLQNKNKEVSR